MVAIGVEHDDGVASLQCAPDVGQLGAVIQRVVDDQSGERRVRTTSQPRRCTKDHKFLMITPNSER